MHTFLTTNRNHSRTSFLHENVVALSGAFLNLQRNAFRPSFCCGLWQRVLMVSLFCVLAFSLNAQDAYRSYIEKYKVPAVEQMYKYGVPASITLAQGLLESGAGRSRLATKANNHFGIKVGSNWRGPYILVDDDAPNEKFRAYNNAAESYEDHSLFLRNNRRYASLFQLHRDDYKRWAKGLKKAGYATNPRYAELLIDLIERYDLHRFDKMKKGEWEKMARNQAKSGNSVSLAFDRQVFKCNNCYYVVAREGDTYADIAKWAGKSERRLRRYNEVPKGVEPEAGDVVYLEKKKSKASRKLKGTYYSVKPGDSLHSIAQMYGIRMETLYKNNNLPLNATVSVGQTLKIR